MLACTLGSATEGVWGWVCVSEADGLSLSAMEASDAEVCMLEGWICPGPWP